MVASSEAVKVTVRMPKIAANNVSGDDMPPDMQFGEAQIISISGISMLFVAGSPYSVFESFEDNAAWE